MNSTYEKVYGFLWVQVSVERSMNIGISILYWKVSPKTSDDEKSGGKRRKGGFLAGDTKPLLGQHDDYYDRRPTLPAYRAQAYPQSIEQ
jgi:hypothetical protein